MTSRRQAWFVLSALLAFAGAAAGQPTPVIVLPRTPEPVAIPQPPPAPVLERPTPPPGVLYPPQFVVEADYLLLRPLRRGQDYAVVGTNPAFAPLGVIHSVDGGFDSGFRVGLGYRFRPDGWEARFAYTYFRGDGDAAVGGANNRGVFPTLTHPTYVSEVAAARAGSSVRLNLFDLDLVRRLELSDTVDLRLSGGPRLAFVDQKLTATYTGGDVIRDDVRRCLCFDGAGVRGGAELSWQALEALGVYLRGGVSMLAGRFHSCLTETADRRAIVGVSERFDRVVPVLDLGLGVSYQSGNFRLTFGYELQNWFGLVEGFDFVDDAHPAKMTRRAGDLGFDGFVLRALWAF